jgi:hypothetical protein
VIFDQSKYELVTSFRESSVRDLEASKITRSIQKLHSRKKLPQTIFGVALSVRTAAVATATPPCHSTT